MATIGGRGLRFSVEVDPKSTKEVVEKIRKYEKDKLKEVGSLIDKTSMLMLQDMRANIPVRTGYARNHTVRSLTRDGGNIVGAEVGTFNTPYAPFIERRTPYVAPAYNRYIRQFITKLKALLRKA